jgi:cytoskeletal protein CcmA (bactofilin family)
MWWEKKSRGAGAQDSKDATFSVVSPHSDASLAESAPRNVDMPTASFNHTVIGRSMVLHGELSGKEDLLIEGQFAGTISLPENCVTVGSGGEVKAEVHARQVVVQGAVTGNISAGEKIEIRKTGHVVGDLVAAAIAIEDGAFFKGSIDVVREQGRQAGVTAAPQPVYGSES